MITNLELQKYRSQAPSGQPCDPFYRMVARGAGAQITSDEAFHQLLNWFAGGLYSGTVNDYLYLQPEERIRLSVTQKQEGNWDRFSMNVNALVSIIDEPFPVRFTMRKEASNYDLVFDLEPSVQYKDKAGGYEGFELSIDKIIDEMLGWNTKSIDTRDQGAVDIGFWELMLSLSEPSNVIEPSKMVSGSSYIPEKDS